MAEIGEGRFGNPEDEDKPRKFTVVDKRFAVDEDEAPSAPPPPPASKEPPAKTAKTIQIDPGKPAPGPATTAPAPAADVLPADEGEEAPVGIEGDPLAIQNALYFFIEELYTRILIFMGVAPNPQTGLTVRNLEQAQRGIQVLETLVKEAKKEATPEVSGGLDRIVSQVKLAYVQLVTGGPGLPADVTGGGLIR